MASLTVGTYLSSVIADGLYEQRRDRVLQESAEIRADLTQSMTQLSGATSTQQQDAANAFVQNVGGGQDGVDSRDAALVPVDRKSTRLNSSHVAISYAVFCLKKKIHY